MQIKNYILWLTLLIVCPSCCIEDGSIHIGPIISNVPCENYLDSSKSVVFSNIKLNFDFSTVSDGFGGTFSDPENITSRFDFDYYHNPIYLDASRGYLPSLIHLMRAYDVGNFQDLENAPSVNITYKGNCTPASVSYRTYEINGATYCVGNQLYGAPVFQTDAVPIITADVTFNSVRLQSGLGFSWETVIDSNFIANLDLLASADNPAPAMLIRPLELYPYATYNPNKDFTGRGPVENLVYHVPNHRPHQPSLDVDDGTGGGNSLPLVGVRVYQTDNRTDVELINSTIPDELEGEEIIIDIADGWELDFFQMNKRVYIEGEYRDNITWKKPWICRVVPIY